MGGRSREEQVSAALALSAIAGIFPELYRRIQSSEQWGAGTYPTSVSSLPPSSPQASQLGVYRAFVDNYGVAMETAEKCCQANAQFAEISEVMSDVTLPCRPEYC